MRKIREVLRLRFELGLGQRAIARACSISQSTVHEYLSRTTAAGIIWPLQPEWDEASLDRPARQASLLIFSKPGRNRLENAQVFSFTFDKI
jgi:transcriptional regulator with XRE-family HTH domain